MSWRSALVAVVLLAACAGSDEAGPAATSGPTATTPATADPPTAAPTAAPAPSATTADPTGAPGPSATTGAPTAAPTTGVAPDGFERVAGRVTAADGSTCEVCLWLAADPVDRGRGLMGVTDLSGADGMLFRWPEPTTGSFWMRDTLLPLSIAFFAADGSFVSAADMEPCLAPTPDAACARYAAAAPYVHAVEVAQGDLPALLIGPGSRLDVGDEPCPPAS